MSQTVTFRKSDAKKQIVWGEIYCPYTMDSQGDFMEPEVIEKMAHDFLRSGLMKSVDTEHSLKTNGSCVVESFVARGGDPDFPEGSWVVGVHIPDKATWAKVEAGEINGFSMYGEGVRVAKTLEVEIPDDGLIEGETLLFDDHVHRIIIKLDSEGQLIGGETDEVNGHSHKVSKGTVTDDASGHNHRYSLQDALAGTIAKSARGPDGKYAKKEGAARGVNSPDSHPHKYAPRETA